MYSCLKQHDRVYVCETAGIVGQRSVPALSRPMTSSLPFFVNIPSFDSTLRSHDRQKLLVSPPRSVNSASAASQPRLAPGSLRTALRAYGLRMMRAGASGLAPEATCTAHSSSTRAARAGGMSADLPDGDFHEAPSRRPIPVGSLGIPTRQDMPRQQLARESRVVTSARASVPHVDCKPPHFIRLLDTSRWCAAEKPRRKCFSDQTGEARGCLPSLVCIGGGHSGSTSLASYLSKHPMLTTGSNKHGVSGTEHRFKFGQLGDISLARLRSERVKVMHKYALDFRVDEPALSSRTKYTFDVTPSYYRMGVRDDDAYPGLRAFAALVPTASIVVLLRHAVVAALQRRSR